jgi:hypothetical protein
MSPGACPLLTRRTAGCHIRRNCKGTKTARCSRPTCQLAHRGEHFPLYTPRVLGRRKIFPTPNNIPPPFKSDSHSAFGVRFLHPAGAFHAIRLVAAHLSAFYMALQLSHSGNPDAIVSICRIVTEILVIVVGTVRLLPMLYQAVTGQIQ